MPVSTTLIAILAPQTADEVAMQAVKTAVDALLTENEVTDTTVTVERGTERQWEVTADEQDEDEILAAIHEAEAKRLGIDLDDANDAAEAIAVGIATPESVAERLDLELVDDAVVVDDVWYADDGNCEIRTEATDSLSAAQAYVESGDWGKAPFLLDVQAYRKGIDASGEEIWVDERTHEVLGNDQPVPDCTADEGHEWRQADADEDHETSGTNRLVASVCTRCGCKRHRHYFDGRSHMGERYDAHSSNGHAIAAAAILGEMDDEVEVLNEDGDVRSTWTRTVSGYELVEGKPEHDDKDRMPEPPTGWSWAWSDGDIELARD